MIVLFLGLVCKCFLYWEGEDQSADIYIYICIERDDAPARYQNVSVALLRFLMKQTFATLGWMTSEKGRVLEPSQVWKSRSRYDISVHHHVFSSR